MGRPARAMIELVNEGRTPCNSVNQSLLLPLTRRGHPAASISASGPAFSIHLHHEHEEAGCTLAVSQALHLQETRTGSRVCRCSSFDLLERTNPLHPSVPSQQVKDFNANRSSAAVQRTRSSVFSGRPRVRSAGRGRPAIKDKMSSNGIV